MLDQSRGDATADDFSENRDLSARLPMLPSMAEGSPETDPRAELLSQNASLATEVERLNNQLEQLHQTLAQVHNTPGHSPLPTVLNSEPATRVSAGP